MNTKNAVRAKKVKIRTITSDEDVVRVIKQLERFLAKMKVAWAGSDEEFIQWSERLVQEALSSLAKRVWIKFEE